jgi:predicted secreted protein
MHVRAIAARLAVVTTTIAMLAFTPGNPAHAAPPHNITINDVSITEGNAGTANLDFTISVSGPAATGITVDYATADVSATAGSDYTATTGTAALANGGCKCATVSVPIAGDTTIESSETFVVDLTNGVGGTITDTQGIGTITNDDFPNASVNDPSVAENGSTMTFTVSLDASAPFDAVMSYTTNAGTATAGADYTTTSGTLTIASGNTSGTVDVPISDDTIYEGDETLTLDVAAVSGVVVADGQGTGTITEDDPKPAITVDDPSVAENGATMTYTISLDAAAAVDISVDYTTSDNTATATADYTATSGTATVAAGATSTTVDVPILDDTTYEGDETLNLDLSGEVNGTLSDAQGQGTITEDDPTPSITVDDPSVAENGATMTFTISMDAAAAVDVSVDYATSDATATDTEDYTGTSGTATITAGATSTTVDVAILDDTTYEGDETLSLDLSGEVNGTLSDALGVGTIGEDDAVPGVSIADASVTEGNAGTKNLSFVVSLTNPSAFDLSVDITTADGSAVAPGDYTAASGDTVSLPAGVDNASATISVVGDTTFESDETLTVTLGNLVGTGTIDAPTATGTITNDDKQASTLTLKATKTRAKVGARGLLEPATTGNTVKVTLARSRNGHWVTVASKTITVRKLADRDVDSLTDAKYGTSFARPSRHGRYRFSVAFAGDTDTKPNTKTVTFKL